MTTITPSQAVQITALVRIHEQVAYWLPEGLVSADKATCKMLFTDFDRDTVEQDPVAPYKTYGYVIGDAGNLVTDSNGVARNVEWSQGHYTAKEIFDGMDEWTKAISVSVKLWDALSDEDKDLAVKKVQTQIETLINNATDLPNIEVKSGVYVDYFFDLS